MNVAKMQTTCPNSLCSTELVHYGQAAHNCEHGVLCRYEQDDSGRVINWRRSMCTLCNARLERETEAA